MNTNQGSASAEVNLSKDKIQANILWLQKNYDKISEWLAIVL